MIIGKRVTLKILEQQDMQGVMSLINDPDVSSLMIYNYAELTVSNVSNMLTRTASGTQYFPIGIYLNDGGVFIGFITIVDIHPVNRSAHIQMFAINPAYWNDGYGEEVGWLVMNYLFLERNIRRVTATSLVGNDVMEMIFKRGFFKLEGVDREAVYKGGKWHDRNRWAVLKSEFNWGYADNKE
jgi:RimJ/RimL family protein N-acetyltransferase